MSINLDKEMRIYADFMTEIKTRQKIAWAMIDSLRENQGAADAFAQAEGAILQTRFVCELIALASLAAHSKFGLTPDLLRSWHAQKTFRLLESINPECFPKAMTLTRAEGQTHFADKPGQITAKELERIYNGCGRLLHRGVIKHTLQGKPRAYDIPQIDRWLSQIAGLLDSHVILLLRHNIALVVAMRTEPTGGVGIWHAGSDGPSVYNKPGD